MSDEQIEYRVRECTRYYVTRYHRDGDECAGVEMIGEYAHADTAYNVGYALAQAEHKRLGWPIADDRIKYPTHPNDPTVAEVSAHPSFDAPTVLVGI